MTLYASVLTGGSNNHETTSEEINQYGTDFVSEGVVGAITNTSGVAPATGAFAVNAQGTPNMTVAVSSGVAYVTATPSGQSSQVLRVRSTGTESVAITSNSSGSTKYDWVYLVVSAANAANPNLAGDNVVTLSTSRSSSASSDDGTPPTYGYPIAVVTVTNGASSITNANIADIRTSTGSTPADQSVTVKKLAAGAISLAYAQITSNFDTISTSAVAAGLSASITVPPGGRRIKVTVFCRGLFNTANSTSVFLTIWDGTVGSGTQIGSGLGFSNGGAPSGIAMAVVTPTAGAAKTYNVGLHTAGSGTARIEAGSTYPAFILVEAV